MKQVIIYLITAALAISMFTGCGPSEEEVQQREQARQDSLEQMRQQRLAEQRQDSIEQARQDSIAAAKKEEEERNRIEFDSDGSFAVQVEAWRSEEKAEAQVQKWIDRGYENAYVVKHGNEDTGDVWFRVRLGHLGTKEMAEKLRNKLQEEYNEPSWISVTNSGQESDEDISE